jgi:hypothetical protein
MYKNSILSKIRVNISNAFGKNINRRIIVFECDDWGSIRTYNTRAYENMRAFGLDIDNNFLGYDTLETNEDLEILFNALYEFKDSTGRPPVMTPLCNMGNPDLNKIIESGYTQYFFQPLHETIKLYPNSDRILDYWKYGITNRLFVPGLHGREHVNINRFMKILMTGDKGFLYMLNQYSLGVSSYKGLSYPNYLGALHPTTKDEIADLHQYLLDSGDLFRLYTGSKPEFFVAPNAEEPKELETTLKKIGIKYIGRAKIRKYPLGDGKYKYELNWLGKINNLGQVILVRNAFFEPIMSMTYKGSSIDWVDNCMKEIEIAFNWKKPVIIASHRGNFVSSVKKSNRDKGINELRRLIKIILKKYPDVEFMTSIELGSLIMNQSFSK